MLNDVLNGNDNGQIPKNSFVSKTNFEKSRQVPFFLQLGISQVLKGMKLLITVGFPNTLSLSEYLE